LQGGGGVGKITSTQVRLSEEIHSYIQQEAGRLGIAQNAFLLVLLDRGRKLWEEEVSQQVREQ